jgi:hypothetical protein
VIGVLTFAHVTAWYWMPVGGGQSFLAATAILGEPTC